jgi:acyl-CoA thioesterase-1
MSASYNIMNQMLMTRVVSIARQSIAVKSIGMALTSVLFLSCGQPESAVVEARPPSSAPSEPAPAAGAPLIVFLGDSLTAGYGLAKEQSVPALIASHLRKAGYGYEVVNAGVSGDTSAGGLSRLDWSLEGDVRILVVELGANDGLRGLPGENLKRNLAEIITRATKRGIKVVLTGMEAPPNFGAVYTSEFRRVYRELAREHNVAFVPFYLEGVAGIPSLNIADGMHPNPEGARIIERTIWGALEPLLDKKVSRSTAR